MMTQPNSNSPVHPLSSGGACPNTAGTNPQEQVQSELASAQIRALLSDERAQQPDFYLTTSMRISVPSWLQRRARP